MMIDSVTLAVAAQGPGGSAAQGFAGAAPPAEAFFLPTKNGARFCLYHAPAPGLAARRAFLYLHPFGEEMNCARPAAAAQARLLAAQGFGVLQLDLAGCGDSEGEFEDARWDLWLADVAAAHTWLQQRGHERIHLWGLRLGALLALAYAARAALPAGHLLLWQPVVQGAQFVTQLLRLGLGGQAVQGGAAAHADMAAMRAALAAGATLEIGGYRLSPALLASLEGLDAARLRPRACAMHWIAISADGSLPTGAQRIIEGWRNAGLPVTAAVVQGAPFWQVPGQPAPAALADTTLQMVLPST